MTPSDGSTFRQAALSILDQAAARLSAREYIRQISQALNISRRQAKQVLQQLIDDQELAYHYLYGNTYIERSFLKPVKATQHFILSPPEFSPDLNKNDVCIRLNQGISFGSGQHPTTRLCLEAIDACLLEKGPLDLSRSLVGADIGTGSGVLALALCLAGVSECRAWEIDPVSVNEAKKNVSLNSLDDRVHVYDTYFDEDKDTYDVMCANLRWPTLNAMRKIFYSSLKPGALLILSGVRQWEKEDLIHAFSELEFELIRQKDENGWSAFVWIKNG